jgi:ATP synthase protein I
MEQNKKPDENPWRAIGLIGVVGVTLAICVSGGFLLGQYMSGMWGGIFTVLAGVILGLAVGVMCIIPMIRKYTGD